jgi:hypothetical protein
MKKFDSLIYLNAFLSFLRQVENRSIRNQAIFALSDASLYRLWGAAEKQLSFLRRDVHISVH